MECVGYDNAFQLELCEKFPLWVPPPKKSRGSRKSSPKKSKVTVAGRKRKRDESPGSDHSNLKNEDESEREATGELSEDEDEVPTYRPRGTRSRPICL